MVVEKAATSLDIRMGHHLPIPPIPNIEEAHRVSCAGWQI
jgi:hypothetical protein